MTDRLSALGVMIVGGLVVFALLGIGIVSFSWPWETEAFAKVETEVTMPEPATIRRIEPIALDCRARVTAEVPVEGRREHSLLGQVYRTDTVSLRAIGDVDTCVSSRDVAIRGWDDGGFTVIVPGDSIRFVRPRVDAVATARTVEVDKGLVGKVTDVFPWVSDDSGLTPAAYAFAQDVIGGTDCMQAAYDSTSALIVEAYRNQMVEQGGDPELVEVRINGDPDFDQHPPTDLGDVEFEIDESGATCEVAADALVASPDDPLNDRR